MLSATISTLLTFKVIVMRLPRQYLMVILHSIQLNSTNEDYTELGKEYCTRQQFFLCTLLTMHEGYMIVKAFIEFRHETSYAKSSFHRKFKT